MHYLSHLLQFDGVFAGVAVRPGEQECRNGVSVIPETDPPCGIVTAADCAALRLCHYNLQEQFKGTTLPTNAIYISSFRCLACLLPDFFNHRSKAYPSTQGVDSIVECARRPAMLVGRVGQPAEDQEALAAYAGASRATAVHGSLFASSRSCASRSRPLPFDAAIGDALPGATTSLT